MRPDTVIELKTKAAIKLSTDAAPTQLQNARRGGWGVRPPGCTTLVLGGGLDPPAAKCSTWGGGPTPPAAVLSCWGGV